MIKILLVICVTVILSAAAAAMVVRGAGPDTKELEGDIAALQSEVALVDTEMAAYNGGIIKMELQLREQILKNTIAMLEQKRSEFLRGIRLTYLEPTPRGADLESESATRAELMKANAEASAAREQASLYSGGLIKSMALVREATAQVTAATIEQRIALMKAGIPLAVLPGGGGSPKPSSPGTPTSDKDAL